MIPSSIIKNIVSPVKTSTTGNNVLLIMDESKLSHLPIVNNKNFLGLISETDLFNNDINEPIGNYHLSVSNAFIKNDMHLFDAIRLICEQKLSLLPIVDNKNVYLGYIDNMGILEHLNNTMSINNPGSIIELELNVHDYSLSEITQIFESNDTKILNFSVTTFPNTTKMLLTIKVDKIDVSGVIQSLNRYDYSIIGSYGNDEMNDYLKDRYDSLMNYLNI